MIKKIKNLILPFLTLILIIILEYYFTIYLSNIKHIIFYYLPELVNFIRFSDSMSGNIVLFITTSLLTIYIFSYSYLKKELNININKLLINEKYTILFLFYTIIHNLILYNSFEILLIILSSILTSYSCRKMIKIIGLNLDINFDIEDHKKICKYYIRKYDSRFIENFNFIKNSYLNEVIKNVNGGYYNQVSEEKLQKLIDFLIECLEKSDNDNVNRKIIDNISDIIIFLHKNWCTSDSIVYHVDHFYKKIFEENNGYKGSILIDRILDKPHLIEYLFRSIFNTLYELIKIENSKDFEYRIFKFSERLIEIVGRYSDKINKKEDMDSFISMLNETISNINVNLKSIENKIDIYNKYKRDLTEIYVNIYIEHINRFSIDNHDIFTYKEDGDNIDIILKGLIKLYNDGKINKKYYLYGYKDIPIEPKLTFLVKIFLNKKDFKSLKYIIQTWLIIYKKSSFIDKKNIIKQFNYLKNNSYVKIPVIDAIDLNFFLLKKNETIIKYFGRGLSMSSGDIPLKFKYIILEKENNLNIKELINNIW